MTRPILSTFTSGSDPFQERPDAHSGLDFAYGPGRVRDDNTVTNVAQSTVTLADNDTNYVEVTGSGTVSANTTGFTAGSVPLYEIVTASSAIVTVTDHRAFLAVGGGGAAGDTAWRAIGAAGQPSFQNGWTNYGSGYAAAGFRKDASGFVHLRGLVKSGSAAIFYLPVGYQTSGSELHATIGNGGLGRLDIYGSEVKYMSGGNGYFSLFGIVFHAGA